uniref:Uncharacterized protein n=1 Tax=Picea sitchensis TaxID=3332 RepID=D5A8X7_PICSI|nr:unknown [Picea sitchensis]
MQWVAIVIVILRFGSERWASNLSPQMRRRDKYHCFLSLPICIVTIWLSGRETKLTVVDKF